MSIPLAVSEHGDQVTSSYLWGLLPDNGRVLDRWAREFQVSAGDAFGLLANVGEDCPGAVQFVVPDRVDQATRPGHVEWLDEARIAGRLRALRADDSAWRPEHRSGRFSLAGAQAKFALLHESGQWGEPSGRTPTTHILKPGIGAFDHHALNEHLCLRTAQKLGIAAASSEFLSFEDQVALVVERFDRIRIDDQWVRVHQEDFCQALAVRPGLKYQSDGGPTVPDIAGLIRRHVSPADRVDPAIRQFADGLAFNFLVGGTDAHAKNYCLLLSGQSVEVGPLYDLASHLPYDGGRYREAKMAMKVGDKYPVSRVTAYEWRKTADILGVDAEGLLGRVSNLAERLPDALSEACTEVAHLEEPFPGEFLAEIVKIQPLLLRQLRSSWGP